MITNEWSFTIQANFSLHEITIIIELKKKPRTFILNASIFSYGLLGMVSLTCLMHIYRFQAAFMIEVALEWNICLLYENW